LLRRRLQDLFPRTDQTARADFVSATERRMPNLFMIWLLLSVLAPHQEVYKIFFHGVVSPAVLILLFSGRARIRWRDPLLMTALILAAYSAITTFIVGQGPICGHIRAFRWSIETFFCLAAFYLWLPSVLARPDHWGRRFLMFALIGAAGGLLLFATGLVQGRVTGLGALHNPIQASSILLIYLAIGHFLVFVRPQASPDKSAVRVMVAATTAVALFVLMSQSRAPIGVLLIYLVYLAFQVLTGRNRVIAGLVLLGGIGLVAGVIECVYGMDHYKDLLLERGLSLRLLIWKGYLMCLPDSLLLGFGAGTDPAYLEAAREFWIPAGGEIYDHAHNLWLGTLARNGLIGLGLLLGIAGLLFKNAITNPATRRERVGLIMILGLVFMLTLTGSHTLIISIKALWLFGWLPLLFVWFYGKKGSTQ